MLKLVINLDRSAQRWTEISAALKAQCIEVQRVSAVDGRELSEDYVASVTTPYNDFDSRVRYTRELSKAELGCFLSHKKCWQRLLDCREDYALILEDDLLISKRAGRYLRDLSWLPEGVEICQLSSLHKREIIRIAPRTLRLRAPIAVAVADTAGAMAAANWRTAPGAEQSAPADDGGDRLVQPLNYQYGTQCYLISRKAAQFALEHSAKIIAPVDNFLFTFWYPVANEFTVWRLVPTVITQKEVPSDIGIRKKACRRAPFWIRHGFTRWRLRHAVKARARRGIRFECRFE